MGVGLSKRLDRVDRAEVIIVGDKLSHVVFALARIGALVRRGRPAVAVFVAILAARVVVRFSAEIGSDRSRRLKQVGRHVYCAVVRGNLVGCHRRISWLIAGHHRPALGGGGWRCEGR
jgi:hypothetical protein